MYVGCLSCLVICLSECWMRHGKSKRYSVRASYIPREGSGSEPRWWLHAFMLPGASMPILATIWLESLLDHLLMYHKRQSGIYSKCPLTHAVVVVNKDWTNVTFTYVVYARMHHHLPNRIHPCSKPAVAQDWGYIYTLVLNHHGWWCFVLLWTLLLAVYTYVYIWWSVIRLMGVKLFKVMVLKKGGGRWWWTLFFPT